MCHYSSYQASFLPQLAAREFTNQNYVCTIISPSLDGPWAIGRIKVIHRTQSILLSRINLGLSQFQGLMLLGARSKVSR